MRRASSRSATPTILQKLGETWRNLVKLGDTWRNFANLTKLCKICFVPRNFIIAINRSPITHENDFTLGQSLFKFSGCSSPILNHSLTATCIAIVECRVNFFLPRIQDHRNLGSLSRNGPQSQTGKTMEWHTHAQGQTFSRGQTNPQSCKRTGTQSHRYSFDIHRINL